MMKKRNDWIRKTLPAVLTLSCVMGTVTPAFAAEAQTATENAAQETSVSTFSVGAAKRDITPTDEMFPLSRKPNVEMTGVLDPLSLRVIAMADADTTTLMICTETGRSLGPQYADIVAEHTGLDLENIVMTSTHTHAAPEVTEYVDLDFEDGDPDVTTQQLWAKYAMEQMLDAVDEALANLKPASVGVQYGESYINVNRNSVYNQVDENGNVTEVRNLGWAPDGPTDREVAAIQFNDENNEPIAFIVNYAVHGTVMHANTCEDGKTGVSGDIPGIVSGYIEDQYDGAVAMWLSGAAGDQNPIIQNDLYTPNPETGEWEEEFNDDYKILEFLSKIHYADVKKTIEGIDEFKSDIDLQIGYQDTTIPGAEGQDDFYISLQNVRIGDIDLACAPCELFSSTGLAMKEKAYLEDTIVVNHAWQREEQPNGYVADDWTIENGGFGQQQAKFQAGYLEDAMVEMLNSFEKETGAWLDNGDGTATYSTTGERVIVGLDGKGGTEDDNRIVNPAGDTLLEDVEVKFDDDDMPYVELGNGFTLTAGADGKIGTTDDTVKFGEYQISEHVEDGKKDAIDWLLLDIQDGKATLVTAQVVDGAQFNLSDEDGNAWADSNLRSWMNSEGGQNLTGDTAGFYNTAFSDEDKAKILLTDVNMNSDSSFIAYNTLLTENWWNEYNTTGEDTQDYVYALSGEEVWKYFGPSTIATEEELGHDPANYTNGQCTATGYAVKSGVKTNSGGNGPSFIGNADSWTRSPGAVDENGELSCGVFLGSVGSLNSGRSVTRVYGARPAITVALGE